MQLAKGAGAPQDVVMSSEPRGLHCTGDGAVDVGNGYNDIPEPWGQLGAQRIYLFVCRLMWWLKWSYLSLPRPKGNDNLSYRFVQKDNF